MDKFFNEYFRKVYKIYKNRNLHVQIFNNLKIIDKKYFVVPERLNI